MKTFTKVNKRKDTIIIQYAYVVMAKEGTCETNFTCINF